MQFARHQSGLILLGLLLLGGISEAANHYVRQGAGGTATGLDWTNACTDFTGACAVSTLVRGDTYYVADGTYAARTFNRATSGSTLITIQKATEADHGIATGWNTTYGDGQAVFGSLEFATANWVFDGITGGGPGSWKTGFGFRISHSTSVGVIINTGANNVTLRHFALIGTINDGTDGMQFFGVDGVTLSYFYLDDIGKSPFWLFPVSNWLAEYGYIGRYFGTGANHSEIASMWGGLTGVVTFRYNIFAYVFLTGGLMWDNHEDHTAQLRVYGNIFYEDPVLTGSDNCCNGWIGGWTGGGGEDNYNMRIYNNTFVGLGSGLVFTSFITRSGNNDASNNLFYSVAATIDYADIQTHNYNHYIAAGGTHGEANGTSAASGNPFVNYPSPTYDFRLTSATTAGQTLGAPYNVDMYGTTRGADGTWDRGAVEFVAPTSAPPTVAITAPTSSPTYATSSTPLTTLAGTASDDVAVSSVTWTCPTCTPPSGTATGTTSWSVASIALASGDNVITVTATDGDSQAAQDGLTVTYTAVSAVPTVLRLLR